MKLRIKKKKFDKPEKNCHSNKHSKIICSHPYYCISRYPFQRLNSNKKIKVEIKSAGEKGNGLYSLARFNTNQIILMNREEDVENVEIGYQIQARSGEYFFVNSKLSLVNHSCDPNCNLVEWKMESEDELNDGKTLTGLVANRNIACGTELTLDYNMNRSKKLAHSELGKVLCRCKRTNCRGTIGSKSINKNK